MAAEADRVAGGDGEREVRVDALMTATADAGHVMGFVIEAHAAAEQASGRAADHPSHQLADLVRKGIGLVEPPDGSVGKAIGVAMPDMSGWIGSHIETTHELDAFREIKDDRIAKNVLVDQVIERAVVEHALYSEPISSAGGLSDAVVLQDGDGFDEVAGLGGAAAEFPEDAP